jgi:pimeloyl-ACP methyl ester carboxylesterase
MLIGMGLGLVAHQIWEANLIWLPVWALAMPVLLLLGVSVYGSILARIGWSRAGLQALLGEFFTILVYFLWRQPSAMHPPVYLPAPAAPAASTQLPIVLVHGFLCNYRIWHAVIPILQKNGHGVMPVNLEPVFSSIDAYASIIEHAVQKALHQSGQQKVILIGHSMGGVAIRAWMRQHGTDRVAGVITLGSPHQGTVVSRKAISPNARQMGWRSPWLRTLAAQEDASIRALFRIAVTAQDSIVFPQKLQSLPGVEAQVFSGMGHLQLCVNATVLAWMMQQIREIQQHPA